ncbi:MAG: hypothetical protein IJ370_07740 [Oscillospiraceae bacterium]|nr:hypothetical protein [Oscillospiraceae bacterium]
MKLKNILLMALSLVVVAALAVGGTLAYLTDRDSKVNVFTIGDVSIELQEEFEQGTKLVPGVIIEKKPVIKNTGDNDAWVWLTFSIPSALDNLVQGTESGSDKNVIHWNPLGATTQGYVTEQRVTKAIADGHLAAGTTAADILANNKTWNVFDSLGAGKNVYEEEIDGVKYNTYVILYNKALTPGETTLPNITKVYLDAQVDIDPEGNLHKVSNGVVTDIDWNLNEDGAPVIYASAYAAQVEGFATVNDAYAAYQTQWGDKSAEYAPVPVVVTSADELKKAIADGETDIVVRGAEFSEKISLGTKVNATFVNCSINGNNAWGYANNATFQNCTFNSPEAAIHFDRLNGKLEVNNCTFTAGKVQIGAPGTAVFNDCVFGATTNTSIWSEKGMRFYGETTFNNCEFNNRVVIAGYNDLPITFNSCTMNSGQPVYYTDNTDGIIRGGNIPAVTINN